MAEKVEQSVQIGLTYGWDEDGKDCKVLVLRCPPELYLTEYQAVQLMDYVRDSLEQLKAAPETYDEAEASGYEVKALSATIETEPGKSN